MKELIITWNELTQGRFPNNVLEDVGYCVEVDDTVYGPFIKNWTITTGGLLTMEEIFYLGYAVRANSTPKV